MRNQLYPAGGPSEDAIQRVREASRSLVRELGFLRNTLAGTDLSPTAVHAVIEVGLTPGIAARDLAALLRLDKSNTSRQLARLQTLGYLRRKPDPSDARSFLLYLTAAGQRLRLRIDRFATAQVSRALAQLHPVEHESIARSLARYADALSGGVARAAPPDLLNIQEGYQPGCIGDIASLHARYYAKAVGFGAFFERKVATELGDFAASLPSASKRLWLYQPEGRTLASLAVDGNEQTGVAHLRWFIVDDSLRGRGLGRELMSRAIEYIDGRFRESYLWTLRGLDAARHLYESYGFVLASEAEGAQWGRSAVEQRFTRATPRSAG